MNPIEQLAHWLQSARRAVAITGAGISTESGIPDFRSPGGVWSRNTPVEWSDFVSSRAARVRYWKQRIEAYRDFATAQPNDGHRALAHLERTGGLVALITQNIDGLHQMAGSRRVIEIHGTARVVACIACGKEWPPEEIHPRIEAGDEAPDCHDCGAPLKSRTISFGQPMPERELNDAARLAQESDVFLAIGSSLVVHPAAALPAIAKQSGAKLAIINRDETPLDTVADVVIRSSIGTALSQIVELIDDRTDAAKSSTERQ